MAHVRVWLSCRKIKYSSGNCEVRDGGQVARKRTIDTREQFCSNSKNGNLQASQKKRFKILIILKKKVFNRNFWDPVTKTNICRNFDVSIQL